jgi:fluoride ion exporter CrcB/FEX
METGQLVTALFYIVGSVIAGIFGIWLSQFLAKQI